MPESLPSLLIRGFAPLQGVAEQVRLKHGLAGVHPVDVAPQGVDFAVVGDVAVGVGALPAGERCWC